MHHKIDNVCKYTFLNTLKNIKNIYRNNDEKYIFLKFDIGFFFFYGEVDEITYKMYVLCNYPQYVSEELSCFILAKDLLAIIPNLESDIECAGSTMKISIDFSLKRICFGRKESIVKYERARYKDYETPYIKDIVFKGVDFNVDHFDYQYFIKIYKSSFYCLINNIKNFLTRQGHFKYEYSGEEYKNITFIYTNDKIGLCVFTHNYVLLNETENLCIDNPTNSDCLIPITNHMFLSLSNYNFYDNNDYIYLYKEGDEDNYIFSNVDEVNWIKDYHYTIYTHDDELDFLSDYDNQITETYILNSSELSHLIFITKFYHYGFNNENIILKYDHLYSGGKLIIDYGLGFLYSTKSFYASVVYYNENQMSDGISINLEVFRGFISLLNHKFETLKIHRTVDNTVVILETVPIEGQDYYYENNESVDNYFTKSNKKKIYIYGK